MKLAVALSTALALVVCVGPAGAGPNGGPNTFACKVLRKAIAGTPLGQRATHFQVNGSGPGNCRYDTGEAGSRWVAQVGVQNYGSALAERLVRRQCKPMVANPRYVGDWLTRAESGADVACRIGLLDKDLTTNNIVYAKGRWYGEVSTVTPSGSAPHFESLLGKVTGQLPR